MFFKTHKDNILEILKVLIIGIFVVITTFPINDWAYSFGIDPPLLWVFNSLFDSNASLGQNIIFPHGPLAFFMYPTHENILLVSFVTALLKILLVFSIYKLPNLKGEFKLLATFAFAFVISIISPFIHLVLATIILLYANFYYNEKYYFKILAFFLTAFAFYVKSYIAIISGLLAFSFIIYYIIQTKKYKKTLIDIGIILSLIVLFRFVIFGSLTGFINYIYGVINLAQDNSTAASYYPVNNWIILSMFLLFSFSIFFVNKSKRAYFYGFLIFLSLFAAWKHGMSREDIYHVKGFLIYCIIVFLIFIFFVKNKTFLNLSISVLAIILLTISMKNSVKYSSPEFELFKANNFYDFVTDYKAIKEKSIKESEKNISINKLPQEILNYIKSETVDVYPWDYSIISANKLNWQPRVVLHSYASYSSWLDKQNANHFCSQKAPHFIVWEKTNITENIYGGDFKSINYRYLLNDEPQTLVKIIENYNLKIDAGKFLLFEKRNNKVASNQIIIEKIYTVWNKWIDVPNSKKSLLRAKLNFRKSFLQGLKSFFYKDEQFWIYLELETGIIHKYRIVPKNAKDGIWINPYFYNTNEKHNVKKIMFTCSNQSILNDDLFIEWEKTEFTDKNIINSYFNNDEFIYDSLIFQSTNNFENESVKFWNIVDKSNYSNDAYNGNISNKLKPNSYSATFEFNLDSIKSNNIKIVTESWVKSNINENNVVTVISIDGENENIIWKGEDLNKQLIDKNQWFNIFNSVEFSKNKENCILKAYLWNRGESEVLIDDYKVIIIAN
jgi:hypothetical protein